MCSHAEMCIGSAGLGTASTLLAQGNMAHVFDMVLMALSASNELRLMAFGTQRL